MRVVTEIEKVMSVYLGRDQILVAQELHGFSFPDYC